MTPEQMAALDAAADAKTFNALQAGLERFKGVPEYISGLPASEAVPDDWCELRLETRAGKIRMTWKSADGDMRDSEWRLRERSNTQLALFVGFLKSFVAKSFGRVPVLKQENVAPLDKPGESA